MSETGVGRRYCIDCGQRLFQFGKSTDHGECLDFESCTQRDEATRVTEVAIGWAAIILRDDATESRDRWKKAATESGDLNDKYAAEVAKLRAKVATLEGQLAKHVKPWTDPTADHAKSCSCENCRDMRF